ncbi:MAG TPA: DUF2125 domain-containing protein [Xanthobacteraceae bacterium]|nr:DUF2125 domain-containing protein [Xanthobacteraceae bacterium]
MPEPTNAQRRRRWPLYLPFLLVMVLAMLWSGAWYYLAARVPQEIADLVAREARAGRVYDCGKQAIGGFPFRIELNCSDPSVQLKDTAPPLSLNAAHALLAWQIYEPSLVIGEFTGPLALGVPGEPARYRANWQLTQSSVRASLVGVERVSIVSEGVRVDPADGGSGPAVFRAGHVELHGRPTAGVGADNPAVDLAVQLVAASAPALHPILAQPLDADFVGVLHGAAALAPKPWPVVFKQWQARGGSLDISHVRVQQGDVIAVGQGSLSLTTRGGLNGELQVTVVELAKVLQALGISQVVSQGDVGSAIDALDRMLPGLGNLARQNAGAGIVAGLGAVGQSTTLEGRAAVVVPLRFEDGDVRLGPFRLGNIPPLF